MNEFTLIGRYFTRANRHTLLSIGDDAALIQPAAGMSLALSADMLVEGRHFLADTDPYRLGWKTLAVNLSDLAAMGATPRWAMLSIALPDADPQWLEPFSAGFFALADKYGVDLIGGDTTRGPRNLSVQIIGEVVPSAALRRDGAKVDDDVWVSGFLGEAALGLMVAQGKLFLPADAAAAALARLEQPHPRVELGLALRGIAHSCIDVSDGLLADLGHILECSGVGAEIERDALPVSPLLASYLQEGNGWDKMLAGGDDYELCFTASSKRRNDIERLSGELQLPLTRIGRLVKGKELRVLLADGQAYQAARRGFDHFPD